MTRWEPPPAHFWQDRRPPPALCRGNNKGKWLGEGGYEHVGETVFNGLEVDVFFREYDSPRAGSFEPLRPMPALRRVVLGLVSTKTPALEAPDDLLRRIDEASRFVPTCCVRSAALLRIPLGYLAAFISACPPGHDEGRWSKLDQPDLSTNGG